MYTKNIFKKILPCRKKLVLLQPLFERNHINDGGIAQLVRALDS